MPARISGETATSREASLDVTGSLPGLGGACNRIDPAPDIQDVGVD